jgi:hypothetical protein
MVKAYFQGFQIFKFGLLIRKDNKKTRKIRIVEITFSFKFDFIHNVYINNAVIQLLAVI